MNNTPQIENQQHRLFVGRPEDCDRLCREYCKSGRTGRLTILAAWGDAQCALWFDSDRRRKACC